jgi:hypothetical protein
MISRAQQILVKRAQRDAALSDYEYRDALELVSGCRSTKDPCMTDRHVDLALAYLEAIFWRAVDAGELPMPCSPDAVFRQRGYWAAKNPAGHTSRDRFTGRNIEQEISELEGQLHALGFGAEYCAAIRSNATRDRSDAHALHLYRTALSRTLQAKARQRTPAPA